MRDSEGVKAQRAHPEVIIIKDRLKKMNMQMDEVEQELARTEDRTLLFKELQNPNLEEASC